MGLFDFLFGREQRKKKYSLMVKSFNTKIAKIEREMEFKNKEIGSLHLQNTNLLEQNKQLIDTIQKLTAQIAERLPHSFAARGDDKERLEAEPAAETSDSITKIADMLEKAGSLSRSRKYKAALDVYDEILAEDEANKDALVGKGICLNKINKKEDALKLFDKAIEVDKSFKAAWMNKGICLDDLGRHKEAIKCFDKIIYLNNGR